MKVAFDTNVLVSAVATRGLCADVLNLVLAEHELIVGETVLGEMTRVLREKLRVPADIIKEFESLLRDEATVTKAAESLEIAIRDKSDIPVLSEAVAGKAEVLVTGDRDLLDAAESVPIKVLSPRGLWDALREDSEPSA